MQIRVIFALPSLVPPSLGALGSCPSRPPLDPPLKATDNDFFLYFKRITDVTLTLTLL